MAALTTTDKPSERASFAMTESFCESWADELELATRWSCSGSTDEIAASERPDGSGSPAHCQRSDYSINGARHSLAHGEIDEDVRDALDSNIETEIEMFCAQLK